MLRVVSDREVAKDAARVNLSALLMGQSRIVPPDRHVEAERLRPAIRRSEDLGLIRRAVSRLVERVVPGMSPLRLAPVRDLEPER